MRRVWFMSVALMAVCSAALGQVPQNSFVVDRDEVRRLGSVVQHVGGGYRADTTDVYVEAMGPPASDADKWFITVLSMKGCPACERLKREFQSDASLRALANPADPKQSWSHYNVYQREDKSQAWRFAALKVTTFPTILVQPPRSGRYGDPGVVVYQAPYGGSPEKLAREITSTIRQYVSKVRPQPVVNGHQQIDAEYGIDPPWQPNPKEDPLAPLPIPVVDPLDVLKIPPEVVPAPTPVPTPNPQPKPTVPAEQPPVAEYPEAVVITDADDGLDAANDGRIKGILAGLRRERGKNFKVRFMDFAHAKDKYSVRRDELPAVLFTADGRIEDKISGRLLPFVQTDRREVGISDLPWTAILTLVSTGFSVPAIVTLAVWGVRFVRSRRVAAGKQLLIDDALFEQIAAMVQSLIEKQDKKPTDPANSQKK